MNSSLLRRVILILFFLLPYETSRAQEIPSITGNWTGTLSFNSIELKVVFKVSGQPGNYRATMDSPDQGAFDIPVDTVIYDYPDVRFNVGAVAGFFGGQYNKENSIITGTWNQGGISLPLILSFTDEEIKINRPQEPQEPFPYKVEEVTFENKTAGIKLAGTLTYPDAPGKFPAVVLVSGSGPQNRDEKLLGHKPFLVLADYLTRNGIAVLRYDDRGVGQSNGNFSAATTEDFTLDAIAAVEFLKKQEFIDTQKTGIIGHSEGGLVAPLAAVQSNNINFIVLLAGPGLRGDSILILQSELIYRANGMKEEEIQRELRLARRIYNVILNEEDSARTKSNLQNILAEFYQSLDDSIKSKLGDKQQFIQMQTNQLLSPWFRFFIGYDPYPTLTKVKCPLLAINGENDLQVPADVNLKMIEKAMKEGGNENYSVIKLSGLNHLFQKSETGSPNEYSKIEETFSSDAMKIIVEWIYKVTGTK